MKVIVKNLFYGLQVVFDEESFVYVLEEVNWGNVSANFTEASNAKGYGTKITYTAYTPRDLSITGWLVAEPKDLENGWKSIEDLKDEVNRLINPSHDLEVICKKYKIKCRAATSIKYSIDYRYNNEVMVKFVIDLVATYPFFTYVNPDVITDSMVEGGLQFPWIIPEDEGGDLFAFVPENNLTFIKNMGDIDAGFLLVCTARYGEAHDLDIINNNTGQFIKLKIELEEGDILRVSTVTQDKFVTLEHEGVVEDITKYVVRGSEFWQLSPGSNDISIHMVNSSNMLFELTYVPGFMEVLQ